MGRGLDNVFFPFDFNDTNFIQHLFFYIFPSDYSEEATPDPIPNSVVKLFHADDTALRGGKVSRCLDKSTP